MTLLVGVLCQDGVVIGADSAATMGSLGHLTIRQRVVKVSPVDGRALIATSGPVGMGQRLYGELEDILRENRLPPTIRSHKAMGILRASFWPVYVGELQAAATALSVVGQQVAQSSAVSSTLLAMCIEGRPRLYQFDQQGAPEEATVDLPFVCLGSGESNADPFMAFLRGLFWEDGKLPTLAEGKFATVWTLEQAIEVSPAYLARPIQLFTLSTSGASCVASEVDEDELGEHLQAVAGGRDVLKDWRRVDRDAPAPPEP